MMDNEQQTELATSLWDVKPWWCQPWSIVLTGVVVPVGSWLGLHRWWVTVPVVGVILVWWLLFLVIVPGQYAEMVQAEMRQAEEA